VAKKFKWDSYGSFDISDNIMRNGVLLGCHNQMTDEKMNYMLEVVAQAEKNIV
jgi:CDP-6-deoxy-D-xylo-4-hexulose-3-dehydrase